MKKIYVTFLLNTVTFDETDVIRTSVGTVTTNTDVEKSWTELFGEVQ